MRLGEGRVVQRQWQGGAVVLEYVCCQQDYVTEAFEGLLMVLAVESFDKLGNNVFLSRGKVLDSESCNDWCASFKNHLK